MFPDEKFLDMKIKRPEQRNRSQSVAVISGMGEMFENTSDNIQDISSVSNSIMIERAVNAEEVDHERNNGMGNSFLDREVEQSGNGLILWLLIGVLLFLLCLLAYSLWLGSTQNYTGYIDHNYYLVEDIYQYTY